MPHQYRAERVAYIDGRVPLSIFGSGYPRAAAIVRALQRHSKEVVVVSLDRTSFEWSALWGEISRDVCCLQVGFDGSRRALLAAAIASSDVLWVSRPDSMRAILETASSRELRRIRVVYDAEAVFSLREQRKRALLGTEIGDTSALIEELELMRHANHVTVVSQSEAAIVQAYCPDLSISLLTHSVAPQTIARDDKATDVLIFGAIHAIDSPNGDGLFWFLNEVYPRISGRIAGNLLVAGHSPELSSAALMPAGRGRVRLLGEVENFEDAFKRVKLAVVPTRYSAGIPLKVLTLASLGIPVFGTDLVVEQIGWVKGLEIEGADFRDAAQFGNQMITAYMNDDLLDGLAARATKRLVEDYSCIEFDRAVGLALGIA